MPPSVSSSGGAPSNFIVEKIEHLEQSPHKNKGRKYLGNLIPGKTSKKEKEAQKLAHARAQAEAKVQGHADPKEVLAEKARAEQEEIVEEERRLAEQQKLKESETTDGRDSNDTPSSPSKPGFQPSTHDHDPQLTDWQLNEMRREERRKQEERDQERRDQERRQRQRATGQGPGSTRSASRDPSKRDLQRSHTSESAAYGETKRSSRQYIRADGSRINVDSDVDSNPSEDPTGEGTRRPAVPTRRPGRPTATYSEPPAQMAVSPFAPSRRGGRQPTSERSQDSMRGVVNGVPGSPTQHLRDRPLPHTPRDEPERGAGSDYFRKSAEISDDHNDEPPQHCKFVRDSIERIKHLDPKVVGDEHAYIGLHGEISLLTEYVDELEWGARKRGTLKSDLDRYKIKYTDALADYDRAKAEVDRVSAELFNTKERLEQAKHDAKNIEKEAKSTETELRIAKEDRDQYRTELSDTKKELENERKLGRDTSINLNGTLQNLREIESRSRIQLDEKEKEIQQKDRQVQEIRATIERYKEQLAKSEGWAEEKQRLIQDHQREISNRDQHWEGEVQKAMAEEAAAKAKHEDAIKMAIADANNKHNNEKALWEEAKVNMHAVHMKATKELREEIAGMRREYDGKMDEKEAAHRDLIRQWGESYGALDKEKGQTQRKLKEVEQRFNDLLAAKSRELGDRETVYNSLLDNYERQTEELKAEKEWAAQLQQERDTLKSEMKDQLRQQHDYLQLQQDSLFAGMVQKHTEEVENLKGELSSVKKSLEMAETTKKRELNELMKRFNRGANHFQPIPDSDIKKRFEEFQDGVIGLLRDVKMVLTPEQLGKEFKHPDFVETYRRDAELRLLPEYILWDRIYARCFYSPFAVFGDLGEALLETWRQLYGKGMYPYFT